VGCKIISLVTTDGDLATMHLLLSNISIFYVKRNSEYQLLFRKKGYNIVYIPLPRSPPPRREEIRPTVIATHVHYSTVQDRDSPGGQRWGKAELRLGRGSQRVIEGCNHG
jgi:hypothetical protein